MTLELSWKKATAAELCEIAYNDTAAPLEHRIAAAAELKRRARQRFMRVQYRQKAVYPR